MFFIDTIYFVSFFSTDVFYQYFFPMDFFSANTSIYNFIYIFFLWILFLPIHLSIIILMV